MSSAAAGSSISKVAKLTYLTQHITSGFFIFSGTDNFMRLFLYSTRLLGHVRKRGDRQHQRSR